MSSVKQGEQIRPVRRAIELSDWGRVGVNRVCAWELACRNIFDNKKAFRFKETSWNIQVFAVSPVC